MLEKRLTYNQVHKLDKLDKYSTIRANTYKVSLYVVKNLRVMNIRVISQTFKYKNFTKYLCNVFMFF